MRAGTLTNQAIKIAMRAALAHMTERNRELGASVCKQRREIISLWERINKLVEEIKLLRHELAAAKIELAGYELHQIKQRYERFGCKVSKTGKVRLPERESA